MLAIKKKKKEREREREVRGKYSLHQGDHQQRQRDGMNGSLADSLGGRAVLESSLRDLQEQSILSYRIYIVWHNIHYQTQRPELVDLCCCYRMFAGL